MDLQRWLWDNEKAITERWLKMVRDRGIAHYTGLTVEELAQELLPFYHYVIGAIIEDDKESLAAVGDWMLAQRLNWSCTLPELLDISSQLRGAIGQTLLTINPESAIAFWQILSPFFDEASIILSDLFTQAIEETLMERLREAEFLASGLAEATEEADRAVVKLKALYDVSRTIGSTLNLEQTTQLIVEKLAMATEADHCAVWLPDDQKLVVVASHGIGEKETLFLRPIPIVGEGSSFPGGEKSLIRQVFTQGQTVVVKGVSEEPFAELEMARSLGIKSMLAVPLIIQDRTIGVVTLDSHAEDSPFAVDEIDLIESIVRQAAVAIENARLYKETREYSEQLEERVEERTRELADEKERLESLYAITRELGASLDLDKVLERTLKMVTTATGVRYGSIMLLDPISDNLVYRAMMGREEPLSRGGEVTPFKRGVGLAGWVLEHCEPAVVAEVTQDERWLELPDSEAQIRSVLIVPLIVGGDVHGVLNISHARPGYFTEAHLKLVSAAASQVATAINNAELYRFVSEQAERLGEMLRTQQEEASKSQAILESIADGVIVNDTQGRILLVNAAAERILQTRSESLIGQNVRNVFGAFSLKGRSEALAAMDALTFDPMPESDTNPLAIQTILEIDNRVISAHLAPVLARNEEFLGIVTVFRDITKEVEADRAKSEFVSTVSHELRTPMTSIKGYSDLLWMEAVGRLNEEQKKFLSIIKSNADRLTDLINDLLDISRIESGRIKLDLKPLQIEEIVTGVVNSLRRQIKDKGLTLALNIPSGLGKVRGDRHRITQILTNLISNAYQYTPSGGEITVSLSRTDSAIRVDVADTGIGIAPEDQSRIFDRFYRADHPLVRESNGTGLGLAIVKMFVEMHGGRIWVDSKLGQGSTFTFILPLMKGVEEEAGDLTKPIAQERLPSAAETTPPVEEKVLVVDDDMDTVSLLGEALKGAGFAVEVAMDGYEAMASARRQRPALILLDLKNGYEALSCLKRDELTREVPVIVTSAYVSDEEMERKTLSTLGAADLLVKPFAVKDLIGRIKRILDRPR
ncbi:MAG: GAF domain-containing protein [Anaerolineae bacterium]